MDNKDLISKSGRVLGLRSWLTALVACWEETVHSPSPDGHRPTYRFIVHIQ